MRDSDAEKQLQRPSMTNPHPEAEQVVYDEKTFFESFYAAGMTEDPTDRLTIGTVTEPESRFQYNAVENSIIRSMARFEPPPPTLMARTWHTLQRRARKRLLDIGSGTGHWIDFFRQTYLVAEVVAVEITEKMSEFLRQKYAGDAGVRVLCRDIAEADLDTSEFGGSVDYISAIGVMFHIVDDTRWRTALSNLSGLLAEDGYVFIGGAFGDVTENVQFHGTDRFADWKEFQKGVQQEGQVRVNKRLRSLKDWESAAADCGLCVADLVRSDRDANLSTPENDLLVLRPKAAAGE